MSRVGPALGLGDPFALGRLGGDAGELADGRPVEGAGLELGTQLGQLFQGDGDAEALFGLSAGPAEEARGVLAEGGVTESQVSRFAVGGEERVAELAVQGGLRAGQVEQAVVRGRHE
jgi:hypothetical protein